MARVKHQNRHSLLSELPIEDRIKAALKAYTRTRSNTKSVRKIALQHGIPWETLRGQISGAQPRKQVAAGLQKLSPFEEEVIVKFCIQLYGWGWPIRISQLRLMALNLLREKDSTQNLGKNWHHSFLCRH
jgi:hypothetical protein